MNRIIGITFGCLILSFGFALGQGNFNSNTLTGNWSNPGSWTLVSGTDADGIPDADDNVTIVDTNAINMDVNSACNTLTFNGNATLNFNTTTRTLTVNGLMTMNGTSSVIGSNNNMILSLQNDFIVPASQSASIGGVQLAQLAARTFTITGTINWSNNTGTKVVGNVILNDGGLWNSTSGETVGTQNFTMFDGATIDGTGTPIINVASSFLEQPSTPGLKANIGSCTITVSGTTTINGYIIFTIAGSGNKTFNNTITVNPGGTWDNVIGEDPNINCSIVNNGNWPPPTGGLCRYFVNAAGSYTYTGSSAINLGRLRVDLGTVTNLTTLNLLGSTNLGLRVNTNGVFNNGDGVLPAYLNFTATGAVADFVTPALPGIINFANANNTVEYGLAGNQNVFPTTYFNLIASNSGTKTLAGNVTVTNQLTLDGSVIVVGGTNTLDGAGNLVMTGTSELRLAKLGTTVPELTGVANSLGASTKITFNGGGSQIARSSTFLHYQNIDVSTNLTSVDFSSISNVLGNLVLLNSAIITNNAPLTVGGTFNHSSSGTTVLANDLTTRNLTSFAGVLNYSGRTITLSSNNSTWLNIGGAFTTDASSTVIFTAGTNQAITGSAATTFSNLTINNSNGVTLSGVNATVSGALNLTLGRLVTGTSILVSTGTVSRTSGFVEGNLRKTISSGSPSATFEVGTNTIYSPVDVVFTGVSVTGTLTASATAGDHPDINGSNIEPLKSINRYWSLTNNGITFTSYSSTFSFDPTDTDPLANTSLVNIRRYNSTSWFNTTVGARTATSTQFTGEAAASLPSGTLQVLQIGETIITTGVFNRLTGARNWNDPTTWIENKTGNAQFTNGSAIVSGSSGTLFLSELQDGDTLVLQTSCDIIRGVVLSRQSDIQLTLTTNASATVPGGYGKLIVPNNNTQVVTIGNSNISLDPNGTTTVTLNQNATVNSINLNTSATPRTGAQNLTHQTGRILTVQTDVNVNQPGANTTDAWNINDGAANVGGSVIIGSAVNNAARIAQVNINSGGILTIQTNLRFNTNNAANAAAAVLDMSSGSGRVNLGGALTFANNGGTLLSGTAGSIFNFNRSASGQSLNFPGTGAFTFHNLYANNTSTSGLNIAASLTTTNLTGDIRVQSGLLTTGNATIDGNLSRTFQVASNATFRMNGNAPFPTGFGTFDLGSVAPFGLVEYNQTNAQSIFPSAYGNLNLTSAQQFTSPSGSIPPMTVNGNLTIGTGGNTRLLGNVNSVLSVTRNLTIASGATLNASTNTFATINVGGDWVNNGTFTITTSTANIVFNGTGPTQPQLISGTTVTTFPNLTINTANTTDRVLLNTNANMSGVLDLRQGRLDPNGLIFSVTNPSTAAIVRTSPSLGYIYSEKNSAPYSELRWTVGTTTGAFVFPFGVSEAIADYIPFTFNVTSAGAPAAGTVSVATYGTPSNNLPLPSGVTNINGPGGINNSANTVDRFWIITPAGFSTTTPVSTLTFTATSTEVGSISNPRAQRWAPANYWDPAIAGQTNPTAFSATVPNISSYSPWALAAAASPLPIQLVSFDAFSKGNLIELNWKTATELNNDFFTIERSQSGEKFTDLFQVKGAGTKQTESRYLAKDVNPIRGTSYYRLKQTDFDGTASFSEVVRVEFNGENGWTVYPNPTDGSSFTIKFYDNDINREASVSLQEIGGKILLSQLGIVDQSAELTIEPERSLSAGLYILTVLVGDQITRQKLVVK